MTSILGTYENFYGGASTYLVANGKSPPFPVFKLSLNLPLSLSLSLPSFSPYLQCKGEAVVNVVGTDERTNEGSRRANGGQRQPRKRRPRPTSERAQVSEVPIRVVKLGAGRGSQPPGGHQTMS